MCVDLKEDEQATAARRMAADRAEIIRRVQSGDQAALSTYLEVRREDLLRYIERNLGDALRRKADAEDIFQEVSCTCLASFDSMDLSSGDPFSWFCRVAERRIIDAHRKYFGTQKRDAAREVMLGGSTGATNRAGLANLLISSITSPSQAVSRGQQEQQLAQAIESLTDDEQSALELRFVENLPSKEIAIRLGKSDGAIRMMLTRAVKRLERLVCEE